MNCGGTLGDEFLCTQTHFYWEQTDERRETKADMLSHKNREQTRVEKRVARRRVKRIIGRVACRLCIMCANACSPTLSIDIVGVDLRTELLTRQYGHGASLECPRVVGACHAHVSAVRIAHVHQTVVFRCDCVDRVFAAQQSARADCMCARTSLARRRLPSMVDACATSRMVVPAAVVFAN